MLRGQPGPPAEDDDEGHDRQCRREDPDAQQVALVEALPQVMAPLDHEMAAPVHDALRKGGVDLHLGSGVTAIGEATVTLADGTELPADVVVAAIGVRPDTTLATEAGLTVGERGGIAVDANHLTNDPDIYAVGDAVEKVDALDGVHDALRSGRRLTVTIGGRKVGVHHRLSERQVEMVLAGGRIPLTAQSV